MGLLMYFDSMKLGKNKENSVFILVYTDGTGTIVLYKINN